MEDFMHGMKSILAEDIPEEEKEMDCHVSLNDTVMVARRATFFESSFVYWPRSRKSTAV